MTSFRRCLLGLVGTAVLAMGCSTGDTGTQEGELKTGKTHFLALSTYAASLGTSIEAFVTNPPPPDVRKIELVFDGTFKRRDGKEDAIKIAQPTERTGTGAIRWTTFGPFENPFTPKNPDIGTFTGRVGARVTLSDGTVQDDEAPVAVKFEVKPSILITDLQPIGAACDAPARRLIGGFSYKMKTQMLGFDATSVDYEFKIPGVAPDKNGETTLDFNADNSPKYRTTSVAHAVADKGGSITDKVDDKDAFELPLVPSDRLSYGVLFSIAARDAKGGTVRSVFAMRAHNALDVYDDGRYELAELYEPVVLTGCLQGGQVGTEYTFDDSKTETQQRSLNVTLSSNWSKGSSNNWSTSDGKSFSSSKSVADSFGSSSSRSNSMNWDESGSSTNGSVRNWSFSKNVNGKVSGEVSGEVGIPLLAEGGVKVGAEVGGGVTWDDSHGDSSSSTSGWSKGGSQSSTEATSRDHSESTTDTNSTTKTDSKGGASTEDIGEGKQVQTGWTVSSSNSSGNAFKSKVVAGKSATFYRQKARYVHRSFVLEYNVCGESSVIGEVTMEDYVWGYDIATADKCPAPSNFPKAQCLLSCDK